MVATTSTPPGEYRSRCRWIAGVAVVGAAGHVGAALIDQHGWVLTVVFAVMALLCVPCAAHLLRGSPTALRLVAANAAGMVVAHLVLAATSGGHHTGSPALAVLTVVECGIAASAWYTARHSPRPARPH
ncbi:hypothetical protein [Saccharopolyspora sp. NPDC002686]|uniref:hypothetical protein n=1 Tax=Saccharopolyspora sp. NPDC002686 TaxID=3154541 RepID=UPI00331B95C6